MKVCDTSLSPVWAEHGDDASVGRSRRDARAYDSVATRDKSMETLFDIVNILHDVAKLSVMAFMAGTGAFPPRANLAKMTHLFVEQNPLAQKVLGVVSSLLKRIVPSMKWHGGGVPGLLALFPRMQGQTNNWHGQYCRMIGRCTRKP